MTMKRTARARAGEVNRRMEDLGGLGGDIGARDATPGELASGFSNTVLGHADTDHILAVPDAMAQMIMLANKTPNANGTGALASNAREVLRKQVWDWKIRPGRGNFECLRREYATSDSKGMIGAIEGVCARVGWTPATLEETAPGKVLCEIGQDSIKGICENDFILAAKIDADQAVTALVVKEAPKKRVWF